MQQQSLHRSAKGAKQEQGWQRLAASKPGQLKLALRLMAKRRLSQSQSGGGLQAHQQSANSFATFEQQLASCSRILTAVRDDWQNRLWQHANRRALCQFLLLFHLGSTSEARHEILSNLSIVRTSRTSAVRACHQRSFGELRANASSRFVGRRKAGDFKLNQRAYQSEKHTQIHQTSR